jgi:hypothetical protein
VFLSIKVRILPHYKLSGDIGENSYIPKFGFLFTPVRVFRRP